MTTDTTVVNGEFICVVCPNGCAINASFERAPAPRLIASDGWRCKRGEEWIRQEIESPMRTIATSVLVKDGDCICASVRTRNAIPLAKVREVMDYLRGVVLEAPLCIGDVAAVNPGDSGSDIIVTRNVSRVDQ
jgi:CxxC motif-containing protein